jgi:hypothetical protein
MAHHEVKIIEDSRTPDGSTRITTFAVKYWRAFHGEVMTHRVFSRNASSSRAIPIMTMLRRVWNDPAMPTYWGSNKPGMQAGAEIQGWRRAVAKLVWIAAGRMECAAAYLLHKLGVHKQIANRRTEADQYISVVITATEYRGFFELRDHDMAMPEFRDLAAAMKAEMRNSIPKLLKTGQWHLPFITRAERKQMNLPTLLKVSTARCARTSYNRHDGTPSPVSDDVKLHDGLVIDQPIHASPAEHQVSYDGSGHVFDARLDLQGNLRGNGIIQYRKLLENPAAYDYYLGEQHEREI